MRAAGAALAGAQPAAAQVLDGELVNVFQRA